MIHPTLRCTAFAGPCRIASGELRHVALKAKQAELQAVVDKLGELKARYDASVARKEVRHTACCPSRKRMW